MIEVRGLTKRFGRVEAVRDVSFRVEAGETFALLGPNGSGKTTTLKCIVGLASPTSGEVLIAGLDNRKNMREAKGLFSYLPQRVGFPESLTAREVLEFYCRLRKVPPQRVETVLRRTGYCFNGSAGRPVGEFSGGMLQRLGVVVSILPDAPILILDEPTISLDPEGALLFREFIASLKREGKTIVFSSHVLSDIERLADRVAILVGGRLAALESVAALRNELASRSRLRLALRNPEERFVGAARDAGASDAVLADGSLVVFSRPEDRLPILRAIEDAGALIERFTTEEPTLEETYLRHLNDKVSAHPAGRGDSL